MALLLALLRWLELKYLFYAYAFEIYALLVAVLFLVIGIWASKKFTNPRIKTAIREQIVYRDPSQPFQLNQQMADELSISNRELEVLQLLSAGLSNQEIANRLFVSPNTIKTHLARLFEKLSVGKRAQAIDKAKRLGLIP